MRLSDRQWKLLEVMCQGEGLALGPVVEALRPGTGWSRNTVFTYLTRMEGKGLVTIDKQRVPHLYRPAVARSDCSAGQMVAAFLKEETLTTQEREELRRLLDEMEV